MARVKTEQELAKQTVQPTETTEETKVETTETVVAEEETTQTVESVETVETEEVAQTETPEWTKRIMANFSNLEELYITKHGGVFTKDTPKSLVKGATLYKNPYYNK